jgi:hypothetical protein
MNDNERSWLIEDSDGGIRVIEMSAESINGHMWEISRFENRTMTVYDSDGKRYRTYFSGGAAA